MELFEALLDTLCVNVSVGTVSHLVQHGEDPARGAVPPARQQPHVGHVLEHLDGGARAALRQVEHLQGSRCRDPGPDQTCQRCLIMFTMERKNGEWREFNFVKFKV